MTPLSVSCKKYSTNHTNAGSYLIYSHLFYLIYSPAKDPLYCIFLLNNRTILKNLHASNQTILQSANSKTDSSDKMSEQDARTP